MYKAVCVLMGASIKGTIWFSQEAEGAAVTLTGEITGLSPGLHGISINQFGDTTDGYRSTGPHFNTAGNIHGDPEAAVRHNGDLGNLTVTADGKARVDATDSAISLSGSNSIIGRAVVIYADPDDLGRSGHDLSKTTGNAGAGLAFGVIGVARR